MFKALVAELKRWWIFLQCFLQARKIAPEHLINFYCWKFFFILMTQVAYNGFKFDGPILLKKAAEHQLESALSEVVVGFVDPLEASKRHFATLPSKSMEAMLVSDGTGSGTNHL